MSNNPKVAIIFDSYENYLDKNYALFINSFPDLQNINSITYSQIIELQQDLEEKEVEELELLLFPSYTYEQYSHLFDLLDEIVFLKLLESDLNTFSSYKEISEEYPDCELKLFTDYTILNAYFRNILLFSLRLTAYK